MSKVDDILDGFKTDTFEDGSEKHSTTAKQQLLAEVLDMIGEDEEQLLPNPANDNYDAIQRLVGRNQQRAQLRQAAKERFK